jgi:methionyl-tRNA formyltransferase
MTINIFYFGISKPGLVFLERILKSSLNVKFIGVCGKLKKKNHADKYEKKLLQICKKNKIKFYEPSKITPSVIRKFENSLGIIGGHDKILDKKLINSFNIGVFNFHFGIIPYTRGCNPTMWSILQGDIAGYTIYRISEKIDLGDIVLIKKYKISKFDTSEILYNKFSKSVVIDMYAFLRKILIKYSYSNNKFFIKSTHQNLNLKNNYFSRHLPNSGYVSWFWTKDFISRFNRAFLFQKYKTIKTIYNGQDVYLKIINFKRTNKENIPGTVLYKQGKLIKIAIKKYVVTAVLERYYSFLNQANIVFSNYISSIGTYNIKFNYNKKFYIHNH